MRNEFEDHYDWHERRIGYPINAIGGPFAELAGCPVLWFHVQVDARNRCQCYPH
jgi:hypothetical protein